MFKSCYAERVSFLPSIHTLNLTRLRPVPQNKKEREEREKLLEVENTDIQNYPFLFHYSPLNLLAHEGVLQLYNDAGGYNV